MDIRERVAQTLYYGELSEYSAGWEEANDDEREPFYVAADQVLSIMGEDGKRLDWLEDRGTFAVDNCCAYVYGDGTVCGYDDVCHNFGMLGHAFIPQEAEPSEGELKPLPQVGEVWKHRSGHLYRVLMLAMWEPTLTTCVVYQRVGGFVVPIREWVRPLDVFLERFTLHSRAVKAHGDWPLPDDYVMPEAFTSTTYTDEGGTMNRRAPDYPGPEELGYVYCHGCSEAGGADMPIYHEPPVCKSSRDTPIASEEE